VTDAVNAGMSDDEWRFELSDLPDADDGATDDGDDSPTDGDPSADDASDDGNVAGAFGPAEEIEPGSPVLEHIAFVALGIFVTLVLFAGPMLGLAGRQIVTVLLVAVLAVAGIVAYVERTGGDA
jgi:hypothetical protein